MNRTKICAGIALACLSPACEEEGEPRPQLLVVIDTDLPAVLQASEQKALSADAAVDSLRIDVYRDDGALLDSLILAAPSALDWPISFGIPPIDGVSSVIVQARVFRADRARLQDDGQGGDGLVPPRPLTVERLVALTFPEKGLRVASFTLSGDCLGMPPSFEAPASSCIDGKRLDAPATEGVQIDQGIPRGPSAVGSWPLAREEPCAGAAPDGALCIPGGVTTLGEEGLTGATDGFVFKYDPVPLRPVLLSPFFADVEEYTVGRLRDQLRADPNLLEPGEVILRDPQHSLWDKCTYLGTETDASDALPLNCVLHGAARKLCQKAGGDLLSEAQWEHAARGRGQGRPFAWKLGDPDCCHGNFGGCSSGPVAVGTAGCGSQRDETRDGLLDMTGNVSELMLDSHVAYDGPCWSSFGLLSDVVCNDRSVLTKTWRGGNFSQGGEISHLALRRQGGTTTPFNSAGFRCGYPDVAD